MCVCVCVCVCVCERERERAREAEGERERIKYIMYILKATKYKGEKSKYIFSQVFCGFLFPFEKLQYKHPSQVGAFYSGYLFILLSP